jgi:hypothetical protein
MYGITLNNNLIKLISVQCFKESTEPDTSIVVVVLGEGVGSKGETGPCEELVLMFGEELLGLLEHCWVWRYIIIRVIVRSMMVIL